MAALTANAKRGQYGVDVIPCYFANKVGLAAAACIFQGAVVFADASGNAVPGGATAITGAVTALGVAEEKVDNTLGGANALYISKLRRGAFEFKNLGGDAITAAHIGLTVYCADDQTARATSNAAACPALGKFLGFMDGDTARPVVSVGV